MVRPANTVNCKSKSCVDKNYCVGRKENNKLVLDPKHVDLNTDSLSAACERNLALLDGARNKRQMRALRRARAQYSCLLACFNILQTQARCCYPVAAAAAFFALNDTL